MSRSRKKNAYSTWTCCKSRKKSKGLCNKLFRRISKIRLMTSKPLPMSVREVMDEWDMEGDGKYRVTPTADYYLKVLRK